jgi:PucR family transcriptional regulator, purine catabolism regulatory protein
VSRAEREAVEAQTAFTLADALALPVMQEGTPEVLAGEPNLGRPIRWVHSGEFPDMPAVLKGGELLLTHGMSIGVREERQRHYIGDLARAGLAGLVIELGAGMRGVPSAVVDEARRHQLPLIVLHRPIPWVEVTEAVHRTIVSRQSALLERGQQLQDQFAALLAAGAGVAEVLRALADLVHNPIVFSREGEILYSAPREHQHAALASAWEAASRGLPQAPATVSVPVDVAGDVHWGLASVIAMERPLDPFDRIAMGRAVPILALASCARTRPRRWPRSTGASSSMRCSMKTVASAPARRTAGPRRSGSSGGRPGSFRSPPIWRRASVASTSAAGRSWAATSAASWPRVGPPP